MANEANDYLFRPQQLNSNKMYRLSWKSIAKCTQILEYRICTTCIMPFSHSMLFCTYHTSNICNSVEQKRAFHSQQNIKYANVLLLSVIHSNSASWAIKNSSRQSCVRASEREKGNPCQQNNGIAQKYTRSISINEHKIMVVLHFRFTSELSTNYHWFGHIQMLRGTKQSRTLCSIWI